MKRFITSVGWFGAGAVLGQLTHTVVFQLWDKVGLLLPIGHWIAARGGNAMVKCWFILWVNTPNWLFAALVGILEPV